MANRVPPKKKKQQTKTNRQSTRIAGRNKLRQLVETGQGQPEVDFVGNRVIEMEDSGITDMEEILESNGTHDAFTNLETSRVLDSVVHRVTRPLNGILRRSMAFVTDYWHSTNTRQALQHGRDFVDSIMRDIVQVPGKPGIGVMCGVPSLTTGIRGNIFIRYLTQPFWKECISLVNAQDMRVRVCAVGRGLPLGV